MRQEHLAAIAHLNTFAKKRASKLSTSQSGVMTALFAKHLQGGGGAVHAQILKLQSACATTSCVTDCKVDIRIAAHKF